MEDNRNGLVEPDDYVSIDPSTGGTPARAPARRGGAENPRPVLAVGVFDGVHLGHRSLLRTAAAEAGRRGAPVVALTFWPHPEAVLGRSPAASFLLSTLEEKVALLRQAGAERVLILRFDRQVAATSPEHFVAGLLEGGVGPQAIVVGFNFTFGRGGLGDPALLAKLGRTRGLDVIVHPAVRLEGEVVSSSGVRSALAAGAVERAGLLLGRPYSLSGPVRRGAGRGRKLGFPTANVSFPPELISPAPGVYICSVARRPGARLNPPPGETLPAVANIGWCPTFTASASAAEGKRSSSPGAMSLEAHVLAGQAPDYGEEVRVFFHQRLRSEVRFPGPAELAAQIGVDRAAAAAYFGLGPARGPG